MSSERSVTRVVESWLEEGPAVLPDRVLDAVEALLPATHQRRAGWLARRFPMIKSNQFRFGVAGVAVVVLAIIGWRFLPSPSVGGPIATPTPTLASATPNPTPSGPTSLIDAASLAGTIPAGDYYLDLPAYPARIDFTVPDGWWYWTPSNAETADDHALLVDSVDTGSAWGVAFLLVDKVRVNPCSSLDGYMDQSVTQSSATLAAAMGTWADFPTAVTDVTIGGFSGKRVEVRVAATVTCRSVLFTTPTGYGYVIGPAGSEPFDNPIQYTFLDVNGSILALWTTDYPGTNAFEVEGGASPDPEAHVADQVALHGILDSIVFTPH